MGTTALYSTVGSDSNMQTFLIASCLAVAALDAPEADADAYYGHGAALVGPSGLSAAWPGAYGPGLQSTCYGCRPRALLHYGKRSADADADAYYGLGLYSHGYGLGRVYGHGLAYHGGHATSFVARSPQGLSVHGIGKRSADADADAYCGLGLYGHGYALGHLYGQSHYGISQAHPSGHSFQSVHRLHKREADADADADAYYGYYGRGYGHRYGYGHHRGYYGHGYGHGGYYGHGYGYHG